MTERRLRSIPTLKAALQSLRKAPLPLLFGGSLLLLLSVVDVGLGVFFGDLESLRDRLIGDPIGLTYQVVLGGCCIKLLLQPLRAWLLCGYARMVGEVAREGTSRPEALFGARGWFAVFVTTLASSVVSVFALSLAITSTVASVFVFLLHFEDATAIFAGLVATLLFVPFLVFVWLGLLFAPFVSAVFGTGTASSVRRSWEFAAGRRLALLRFRVLTWIAALAGVLACCVGGVATWSWAEIAWLEATREAFGDEPSQAS